MIMETPNTNLNIVPFSKSNVNKDPIPHNIFLTMGPMPLELVVSGIAQVEEQGWVARFIVPMGTQRSSGLALAQSPSFPVFNLVICKVFNEGCEIVNPSLNFGQPGK